MFSTNLQNVTNGYEINITPQIINQSGYIADTTQWTQIQGCFTANGGEQYITIGNFTSNFNTDTLNTHSTNLVTGREGVSYYYIDDITLIDQSTVGVRDMNDELGVMSVYPNPANDVLNPVGGLVNFNPDAAMTRVNLHSMPMVGVKELQKPGVNVSLLIYPNPTNNMLNIISKFEFTDNVTIEIINLLGQTVYIENLGNKTEIASTINVGQLSNGVYNVSVKGNKFHVNKLFIKQ